MSGRSGWSAQCRRANPRAEQGGFAKQGPTASPARGFYVVVPPECSALGCLPADQFIPALMGKLGQPCCLGPLSAAQHRGAARHRPQETQAMAGKSRRPITCGAVRVAFIARKDIARTYAPSGVRPARASRSAFSSQVGRSEKGGGPFPSDLSASL